MKDILTLNLLEVIFYAVVCMIFGILIALGISISCAGSEVNNPNPDCPCCDNESKS